MMNLSTEKRNQLLVVGLVTGCILAGLWFGLIQYQFNNLQRLADKKNEVSRKLRQVQDVVKNAEQLAARLTEANASLAAVEADTASGDLYSWQVNTLRRFKTNYRVELSQFSPVSEPTDVNLLPNFPYKQISSTVVGVAHFHDFGRFLADFENRFPHIRVLNLNLEVNGNSPSGEGEMLTFRMEIATLVKIDPS